MEQLQRCSACGLDKPQSGWAPSRWGLSGQWCKECYREWHRSRYTPKAGADDIPRDCAWCGQSYRPKQRKVSVYCSPACKTRARNARVSTETLQGKPERVCLHCDATIPQARRADIKYCSTKCMNDARNARKTPEERRARKLLENFGLTGDMFDAMLEAQGSACKICRTENPTDSRGFTPWHVDHDHASGAIRGILCGSCNLGLGLFKDSPAAMRSAAAYLRAARGV